MLNQRLWNNVRITLTTHCRRVNLFSTKSQCWNNVLRPLGSVTFYKRHQAYYFCGVFLQSSSLARAGAISWSKGTSPSISRSRLERGKKIFIAAYCTKKCLYIFWHHLRQCTYCRTQGRGSHYRQRRLLPRENEMKITSYFSFNTAPPFPNSARDSFSGYRGFGDVVVRPLAFHL